VALLGLIPLTAGPYALIVTKATAKARLPQSGTAWAVEEVRAIPLTLVAAKVDSGAEPLPWEVASMVNDDE
jgi:hypothetical protein